MLTGGVEHSYDLTIDFTNFQVSYSFQIRWLDLSTLDCTLAVFNPVSSSVTIVEQFGDNSAAPLPYPSTDIEDLAGDPAFCGDRVYEWEYSSGSSKFTIDTTLMEVQATYTSASVLGDINYSLFMVSFADHVGP